MKIDLTILQKLPVIIYNKKDPCDGPNVRKETSLKISIWASSKKVILNEDMEELNLSLRHALPPWKLQNDNFLSKKLLI